MSDVLVVRPAISSGIAESITPSPTSEIAEAAHTLWNRVPNDSRCTGGT